MAHHQIIITCLTGKNEHDKPIITGSINLHGKALNAGFDSRNYEIQKDEPHFDVTQLPEVRKAIALFGKVYRTGNLVFYLRGHGGFSKQTLGGLSPEKWAKLLKEFEWPAIPIFSVTGCRLGRDTGSTEAQPLLDEMNSFASNFHRFLREKSKIKAVVYARTEYVGVFSDGKKKTSVTLKPLNYRAKAAGSKVKFTWAGNEQARTAVY